MLYPTPHSCGFFTSALLALVCLLALQPSTVRAQSLVLDKTGTFTQDAVLGDPAKDVTIPDGAVYRISGGHVLTIKARKLRVEGEVTFHGQGRDGEPGVNAPARTDEWNSSGTREPHRDYEAAGSDVDRGLPGGKGGDGGPGAVIQIEADTIEDKVQAEQRLNANIHIEGGQGGPGGAGGAGRPLRCGEHPNELKLGPAGFPGLKGAPGTPGRITIKGLSVPASQKIVLTVSGGISLGAYEAGYNWGLLRHVKARSAYDAVPGALPALELIGVTGASAGAINTLLTAMTYCQASAIDDAETPANNLFSEAWIPIGLNELLPPDRSAYVEGDALLSRREFSRIEGELEKKLKDASRYKECTLPIGLSVTRKEPDQLSSGSLTAPVDRFSIALVARRTDHGLSLYDILQENEAAYVKPYLHFTQSPQIPVSSKDVLAALRASSSFPFAFGMQRLKYYTTDDSSKPPGWSKQKTDWFWDGGLYDNIPIGLALSFIEQPPNGLRQASGSVQLLALDPNVRRSYQDDSGVPSTTNSEVRHPLGLKNLPRIAGNVLSVARKYEIQNFIRFAIPRISTSCHGGVTGGRGGGKVPCIEEPLVSSRFAPVYGERLGAFGAFVLESFRRFDFAVGVYDAAHSIVVRHCTVARTTRARNEGRPYSESECMVGGMHQLWREVNAEKDAGTDFLFKVLLVKELNQRFGADEATRALQAVEVSGGMSAETWANGHQKYPAYVEELWQDAQQMMSAPEKPDLPSELAGLDMLIEKLAAPEVLKSLPEGDQAVAKRADTWLREALSRLIARAQNIERKDNYLLGRWVTGASSFLLETERSLSGRGLDLDPSSIPDESTGWVPSLLHLAPFHVSVGSDKTLQAGWRPTLGINRRLALAVPFSVSGRIDGNNLDWIGGNAGASLILRFSPWENLVINGVEFGYRMTAGSRLREPMLSQPYTSFTGAEVVTYWWGGKIRIGAGMDDLRNFSLNRILLTVGLADFNGMVFHSLSDNTLK